MLVLTLLGCLTSNNFDSRFAAAQCAYAQECEVLDLEGFSTLSECENETVFLPDDCEEFDRKQAQKCIEAVTTMTCEEGMSGTPRACNTLCP